jgi:hypothetical protein
LKKKIMVPNQLEVHAAGLLMILIIKYNI